MVDYLRKIGCEDKQIKGFCGKALSKHTKYALNDEINGYLEMDMKNMQDKGTLKVNFYIYHTNQNEAYFKVVSTFDFLRVLGNLEKKILTTPKQGQFFVSIVNLIHGKVRIPGWIGAKVLSKLGLKRDIDDYPFMIRYVKYNGVLLGFMITFDDDIEEDEMKKISGNLKEDLLACVFEIAPELLEDSEGFQKFLAQKIDPKGKARLFFTPKMKGITFAEEAKLVNEFAKKEELNQIGCAVIDPNGDGGVEKAWDAYIKNVLQEMGLDIDDSDDEEAEVEADRKVVETVVGTEDKSDDSGKDDELVVEASKDDDEKVEVTKIVDSEVVIGGSDQQMRRRKETLTKDLIDLISSFGFPPKKKDLKDLSDEEMKKVCLQNIDIIRQEMKDMGWE